MRKTLFSVLLLLLPAVAQPEIINQNQAGTDPPSVYQVSPAASSTAGWQLVWSDEFDNAGCISASPCSIDSLKWKASDGNRWQDDPVDIPYYTSRLKNVRVQDGLLIIETHKETYGGKQYTSGTVETRDKKHFDYGKLEIRAKGTSVVNNMDQAIWTLGVGNGGAIDWPADGEVDIVEFWPGSSYWSHTKVAQSFHTAYDSDQPHEVALDARTWHVYFMEWDNNGIKLGVDGVVKVNKPKNVNNVGDSPWDNLLYLLITTQLGSIGGGTINNANFPFQFEVDYVRYYQLGAQLPSIKIPTTPGNIRVE